MSTAYPFWQEEALYYSPIWGGATDYWQSKISLMKSYGIEVQMFDYLEAHATENERKEGYDIADYQSEAR